MPQTLTTGGRSTLSAAWALWSLLLGVGLLMLGNGLQGSLLGIRASSEGFGDAVTGLIMSAYFAGFLAGSTLTPRQLRSVGHIRVFAALASITSVSILVHAIYVVPWVWALMRFVTGFAYAGLYVVSESWLNSFAANELRGRLLALYMVISYLGMGGGQLLLNTASPDGVNLFILVSILMSLALVPMLLSATRQPDQSQPESMGLRRLFVLSPLGTVGCFATGIANGAIFGMGAVFAARSGLPLAGVSLFMGAFILGGAALQWPLGKLSDMMDRRWVVLAAALAAALLAVASPALHTNTPVTMVLLAAAMGGTTLTLYSLFLACANDQLTPSQTVAASGTLVLLLGTGAVIGPFSVGLLMDVVGPTGFLWDLGAIHLLIATYTLYSLRHHPVSDEDTLGHYVVVPSQTAPLGTTWTDEATGETDGGQMELDLGSDSETESLDSISAATAARATPN